MIRKLNIVNIATFPKQIHSSNVIHIKISTRFLFCGFFVETKRVKLKVPK